VTRHAAAIGLFLLAWGCSGLGVAGVFAAEKGKRAAAAELAIGVIGTAGLAWAGAALW